MRYSILSVFFLVSLSVLAQEKLVAFTFDDLPFVSYRHHSQKHEFTLKLLNTLKTNNLPAIGFVNEYKLYADDTLNPAEVELLELWLEYGNELGNHTFSHPSYHKTTFDLFSQDILKGENVSKQLSKKHNIPYRYFRHPYLHSGENKEKNDSLQDFLKQNNYLEAPITIDNSDYLFAYAYDSAMVIADKELMRKIGEDYIEYMELKLVYFELQSLRLFQKNINHILLLHANALNADYVGELAQMFRKNDYRLAPLEDVLKDTLYNTAITVFTNRGISWLDRWALSAGIKGDFFQGDPEPPDYILRLAKVIKE